VIDCLEYSANLRTLDPLDDLSCLAVECEYLGRPDVSETLIGRYRTVADDAGSPPLEALYKSLHATMRAAELFEFYRGGDKDRFDSSPVSGWVDLAARYCRELA
jgi:aminoglycoside phosphotransferase family enzyme